MESPSDVPPKLSVLENPNYELHDLGLTLPIEFQTDLEARANELAQPVTVIGPLMTGSWGIVAASPGVGKSMWMAALIKAIAGKVRRPAGDWMAPERRTVLLIDAEMSPVELAGRYATAELEDWCAFCSIDLLDRHELSAFSLGAREDQQRLFDAAAFAEVIVIDNIEYTLEPAPGHNIFAPETWAQVEPITRWAKARNKLLILVDHLNKEGGVQGSLSKQRGASFVIRLEPEYIDQAALAFTSHFSKLRYVVEDESLRRDRTWIFQDLDWRCEIKPSVIEQVLELHREGEKQKAIAAAVGIGQPAVSKILRKNKHRL